jgi:formylglycine-generating enzyme required for sulfatase activity
MGKAITSLALGIALVSSSALAEPTAPFRDPVTGMELLYIPGGTFAMGCIGAWIERCFDNEKPAHEVTLSPFRLGRTEVTQAQWRAVMGDDPPDLKSKECGDNCPVESVAWDDVQEFIKKLNGMGEAKYRLPSEAEWEYACRSGGKEEIYAGGAQADELAWYESNSNRLPHPVASRSPNALGLHDMSGNVWEWVQDIYGSYSAPAVSDPVVESGGSDRLFRGGFFGSVQRQLRCTIRSRTSSSLKVNAIGFRLAMTP